MVNPYLRYQLVCIRSISVGQILDAGDCQCSHYYSYYVLHHYPVTRNTVNHPDGPKEPVTAENPCKKVVPNIE